MTTLQIIQTILKFAPQLISLVKFLYEQIENGISEHDLGKKIDGISNAMDNSDRQEAANRLNNIFRNRK